MQDQRHYFVRCSIRNLSALAVVVGIIAGSAPVRAHEGHAALPSTGAIVEGDEVLVSEKAHRGLGLETATVTLESLKRVLHIRADVELPWDGQAMVTTLAPGRVQTMLVKPGETVSAGQELARIESLALETLQLAMLQAAEEVGLAQRLVDQRRPLVQSGAIRGRHLLEDETELRQRQVQLAIARRKLMALGLSEETLQQVREQGEPVSTVAVTSPLSGVVMHVDVRVGEFVDTEQHLFNIVDRSKVLVVGELLETDAWQVDPNQRVAVKFPALPDKSYIGAVERLRLSVHPDSRTLQVVVPVDNQDGRLRPGMSGRMEVTVDEASEAIACPIEALINLDSRTFVLVRRGEGKYQRREIKTGLWTPDRVEVVEGLFPGDRVVVTGGKLLAAMFHTAPAPHAPDAAAEGAPSALGRTESAEPDRLVTIPVAQAMVELPTGQKSLATPVIEGRIRTIHIEPGETVESGQLLAELDSQELRNLQLELLETQEKLRQVTETIDRVGALVRSGGYPQSQFWQHQMEQKSLQHQLQRVQRTLAMIGLSAEAIDRLAGTDLSQPHEAAFTTVPVRAPAAGRVADFGIAIGEIVHVNDALFEIQNQNTIWIKGQVFEQHAARVEVGQTAVAHFPAYPELEVTGRVVRIAPTLESSTRVLPVWVEAENPGRKLREGMLAEVEIIPAGGSSQVALGAELQD